MARRTTNTRLLRAVPEGEYLAASAKHGKAMMRLVYQRIPDDMVTCVVDCYGNFIGDDRRSRHQCSYRGLDGITFRRLPPEIEARVAMLVMHDRPTEARDLAHQAVG